MDPNNYLESLTVNPSRLHVGLNLAFLSPGRQGGMEVYARELIRRLADRSDLRLTAFVSREAAGELWGSGVETVVLPVRPSDRKQWLLADQYYIPRFASSCDLVHSLASTGPLAGRFLKVTTIHDIMFMIVPDAHAGLLGRGLGLMVRAAAYGSDHVLADSQQTADDLTSRMGVKPARISVVPPGVNPFPLVTPTPELELRNRLGLGDRRIVLSVSPKRPTKNLERLIRAHSKLQSPRPLLVLPGYSTPYEQVLRATASEVGISQDVRFLGWISDEDLEGLYAIATIMAFPSLYEGFGLPPLEAMARGVPVLCSDRGSLREVVGDAALVVDPESVDAIGDGLGQLLGNPRQRASLIKLGRERVPRFSWDRTASLTAAAYWDVWRASGPGRRSTDKLSASDH